MLSTDHHASIDLSALKAQVDADLAAQLLAEANAAQYVNRRGFRIGELNLLVALDVSSEVAEMPAVCRLPGAPHGVKGLVNRHGRVMPVMDVALLLGLKSKPVARPWLLVCGRGDAAVGLMIDNLPERKMFEHSDAINLAEITSPIAVYAKAAYQQNNEIWIDLDTDAFFAAVFATEVTSQ